MKKLSVKNNDILAFIDIDSNKKFYEVYNVRKLSDDKIEVITGTCDSNKNGVKPFRKENKQAKTIVWSRIRNILNIA